MQTVAIECKGIKKSYGKNESRIDALRGIDLTIDHGKLTLLVGPSGSGKTTLLSIITTLLTPDSGELFLLSKAVHKMSDDEKANFCQKHLGIVFQSLFLIPTLTVIENIFLPLLIASMPHEEAEKKANQVLHQLKMSHRAASYPQNLSKGQQQRIAIGRAIVNDADIIVCDEPTSSLDHTSGMEIMALLHELATESKKAVLVVTHDHRIFSFADTIVEISDGQIIREGQHA